MTREPTFSIGIEEEYMLVDACTRDLVKTAPLGMLEACQRELKDQVTPEFLQCQIEVGTRVCDSVAEARGELQRLRSTVAAAAKDHGAALVAASTHPFAQPGTQQRTEKDRYAAIEHDLQEVVRRLAICGMHVHVGIEDDDLRVDLMSQLTYVLPHLLALSTSSPFWAGNDTGLKSYRIAVWDEMPRTGIPPAFESYSEYQRLVGTMVDAGLIEDGTKLWWDVRPSARFPTLEMRICDVCTHLDDAIAIAALYRCWLRMLYRLRRNNQSWRRYPQVLVSENRWRAQRYGIDQGLVDFGRGEIVAYGELLDEVIELVHPDADYFGCAAEVAHTREILKRGTSAHWQAAAFEQAIENNQSPQEAAEAVVDMLVSQTIAGV
jgi:glutamate---cysteine ligase / carboxylate-amine ligase